MECLEYSLYLGEQHLVDKSSLKLKASVVRRHGTVHFRAKPIQAPWSSAHKYVDNSQNYNVPGQDKEKQKMVAGSKSSPAKLRRWLEA
jgi:hypothetical protein